MKKIIACLLFFLTLTNGLAQKKPSEMGMVIDNDLFTSTQHDRYYTSGMEFFYRFLEDNDNPKINKFIKDFRIGQYIYNPKSVRAEDFYVNDRPFAGYLFFEAGTNIFYQNESVLKLSGQLGIVGPASQAEAVQKFIHSTFGYPKVQGWQYQISNTYAIQAEGFYSTKIAGCGFADFHLETNAKLGTIWIEATGGFTARIGLMKLLPVYDSNFHYASLSTDKNKKVREFYAYVSPKANYQVFDATIEGGFSDIKSPVTFKITPWRFNFEAGVKYRKNNWNLSYAFLYRGKELYNNVISSYYYGSIGVSYLL